MLKPRLTILTDPVPRGRYFFSECIKRIGRPIKRLVKPAPSYMRSCYRGHPAVTRSLVEGLQKIGVPYNYNPKSLADIAETVIVLSAPATLRQVIRLKRKGRIRRLLAGPNILVFPSEHREISDPEVDLCITAGDWVCEYFVNDCPELRGRCVAWPAGVDTTYWKPDCKISRQSQHVLLFEKHCKGPIPDVDEYNQILVRRGYQTKKVVYGQYLLEQYHELLLQSSLLVGFVRDENQGIAWAEAWSMDVPTLLWHNDTNTIFGRTVRVSTAPYLKKENGSFFSSPKTLEQLLIQWQDGHHQYRPRQWVLENMSDEVCARQLCELAEVDVGL